MELDAPSKAASFRATIASPSSLTDVAAIQTFIDTYVVALEDFNFWAKSASIAAAVEAAKALVAAVDKVKDLILTDDIKTAYEAAKEFDGIEEKAKRDAIYAEFMHVYALIQAQAPAILKPLTKAVSKAKDALKVAQETKPLVADAVEAAKKTLAAAENAVKDVEALLVGKDTGLSKRVAKAEAEYRKISPKKTLTQIVATATSKATPKTSSSKVAIIIICSVAGALIIGAAVYFFILKK